MVTWSSGEKYKMISRATDFAGNIELVSDGAEFTFDNEAPVITIKIDDDSKFTNSKDITLSIESLEPDIIGLEMAFSFDNIKWTSWETFDQVKYLSFVTIDDGEKHIYCKVRDLAGNIAEPVFDSIILDTTPPHSLSLTINNNAYVTYSSLVTLEFDAVDDTAGLDLMSLSTDGITWSGWENFVDTTEFTLPSGEGYKTIYFKVKDKAGNEAEPISNSIFLKTQPDELDDDDDNDGVPNSLDAFPIDPAASVDHDGDKYPDSWNFDKTIADSTTGLQLDSFPKDPAAAVDSDGDGYPDHWNPGMSIESSTTGLYLDAFPNDAAAAVDSDGDHYPDSWNTDKSEADSTTGLTLDEFPYDSTRHAQSTQNSQRNPSDMVIYPIIIVFILVIIVLIAISIIIRKKRSHQTSPKQPEKNMDKILNDLKYDVIHGEHPEDRELSGAELRELLNNNFQKYDARLADETSEIINNIIEESD